MEAMQLCSVLAATMSADATQRHAAEHTLKQHQYAPGQLTNLLRLAVEDSMDGAVRQVAAITFKNLVKADWDPQEAGRESALPAGDRAAVRDNLLEGIVRAPPAVRAQLGECAKYIVYADYPGQWPGLLPAIVAHLATQDHARLYGGMLMLRLLARKYEFKDDAEREPLAHIVSTAFPPLLAIFQGLLASGSASPEAAELLKLGFKAFWSATYMEIPAPLPDPAAFTGWVTVLHAFVQQPLPEGQPADLEARRMWPWWKAMKWALHISHRLFNRYGDPKKCEAGSPDAAFATLFRDQCAVKFLEAHAALLGRYAEGQWLSPRVVNLTLQYLTVGIRQAKTWKLLQPHVPALMQRVLFPLMCFSDEDQELWEDDPQEYIRKGYDIMEEMYSPKSAASNFLHELCESRQKNLAPFMQQISSIFTEYQAAAGGGAAVPQQIVRRMDGALLAVGALSDILKQKEPYKQELEAMLMTHVAPLFASPAGHLRAKAAWVAGTYADIKFAGAGYGAGPNFSALFRCIVAALGDSQLPVRVDAVMAARSFIDAYSEDAVGEIKGLVPALLDQIFKLMAEVDNEDLVLTLEAIVEKFEDEMAPFAVGLTQHLAAAFWRATAAEEEAEGEDDGLGAYNVLRTLATVLESVSSQPTLFAELEEILFPIMSRMISSDGQDVFEEVLELLAYFTYCSPAISPRLWSLWPQLAACLNEWAVDFFENVLVVLDNFISRGADVFIASRQPDYLASVNQIAEKFLSADPDDLDERDIVHAPKLMEVVLQNCRGRVDSVVAPYLQLALRRYGTARRKLMQDLLLNVVASAFYYNTPLAMGALQQAGAVQPAFTAWLGGVSAPGKHFRRLYDKKVQILGLLAVLTLPEGELPPEVAAGVHDILAAIVKLLSAYRDQQALEALEMNSNEGSVEDSEADSDEGEDVDFDEIDATEEQRANGGAGDGDGDSDDAGDEEEDAGYLERLARIRERIKAGGGHEESDDDSEWTEDEEVSTPVDPVDPFLAFSDAVRHLQSAHPARFQVLASGRGQEQAAAVQGLLQHAETVRAKKAVEAATQAAAAQATLSAA